MPGEIYDVDLRVTAQPKPPSGELDTVDVELEWPDGTKLRRVSHPIADLRSIFSMTHESERIREELCQAMGNLLFSSDIHATLLSLLETHDRVRLLLHLDAAPWWDIPWEAAYFAGSQAISLHPKVSFVRRHSLGVLQTPAPAVAEPLKVAYATGPSGPLGGGVRLDQLPDPRPFLEGMQRKIRQGRQVGALELGWSDLTSWGKFRDAAIESDVAQFAGHGYGEGTLGLVFADSEGQPDVVHLDRGRELEGGGRLQVVLLSACQSATRGAWSKYASWAALNCRCLVLMQGRVMNKAAEAFTEAFYLELSTTGDLDEAIGRGRWAMHDAYRDDDCAVVVYSRYPKGPTVLVRPTPDPAAAGSRGDDPAAGPDRERTGGYRFHGPPVRFRRSDPPFENPLESWIENRNFENAVRPLAAERRTVTPLLGSAVTTMDPMSGALRWDMFLEAAIAGTDADPELSRFVRNLVADRWDRPRRHGLDGPRREIPFTPTTDEERSISEVRVALGKLACQATTVFVSAATRATVPLDQWDDYEVAVTTGDPLFSRLHQLIDLLERHNERHGADDNLFGGVFLKGRLCTMQRQMAAKTAGLTGSTVRWLTNVFWHAVICDSPVYPSLGELELQVSLFVNESRPTRDFGAGASLIRYTLENVGKVAALALRRGFDPDEPPDSKRRAFYRSLGTVMHGQFADWRALMGDPEPIPLVVTSNLDLELERALAATGDRFHVAVPVYFAPQSRSSRASRGKDGGHSPAGSEETIRWLVGTFSGGTASPTVTDLQAPVSTWRWLRSLVTERGSPPALEGPLLLKLNGSPLHRIPDGSSGLRTCPAEPVDRRRVDPRTTNELSENVENESFQMLHAIALGEFDFLQVTRVNQWSIDRPSTDGYASENGLPGWLVEEILNDSRYWVLLGYNVADWSSRIQLHTLFTHVSPQASRGCAVAPDFDEVRLRFLDWLGIAHVRGNVTALTPAFESLATEYAVAGFADRPGMEEELP